ncbi:hypothetical protein HU200_023426 [Digitaria exilis]|uniref:DUF4005 domain-containing protein n=1 Tax=Digitaria exilis TaxID=1010633 RepID=A0A835C8Y0_9POAL|nr:hypothetical protein HU200_023426 [Digitaria exilis]
MQTDMAEGKGRARASRVAQSRGLIFPNAQEFHIKPDRRARFSSQMGSTACWPPTGLLFFPQILSSSSSVQPALRRTPRATGLFDWIPSIRDCRHKQQFRILLVPMAISSSVASPNPCRSGAALTRPPGVMAEKAKRRRSWFERIRRLFTSEPKEKPKPDKKAKSKRWLPGKLRTQQSFALPAPAPAPAPAASDQQQIRQAEDEQSKHAMAVALATAAAAEAAVAAAHAAAEVVRLTGPQQPPPRPPGHEHIEREHEQAAVAIQSAYRGYLARRALRALKGLVRLQALIRGQAVRRQTAATLRGLESLMRIQARHRSRSGVEEEDDDDDAMLLRRGRELYAAAVHKHSVSGGERANDWRRTCAAPCGWRAGAGRDRQGGDATAHARLELGGRVAAAGAASYGIASLGWCPRAHGSLAVESTQEPHVVGEPDRPAWPRFDAQPSCLTAGWLPVQCRVWTAASYSYALLVVGVDRRRSNACTSHLDRRVFVYYHRPWPAAGFGRRGGCRQGREQQQQQAAGNKGWDSSIFSKEEMSAMTRSREEAALKRVRALQYASLQSEKLGIRRPPLSSRDEMDTALNHQRWSWLDEWVGSQPPFDKDVPVAHQSPYTTAAAKDDPTAKSRRTPAAVDPLAAGGDNDDRLGCSARRSFVRPRRAPARAAAAGDYYYYYDDVAAAPCSPAPFPGYMASTASAKAKFRSMSTPKERAGGSDAYSEHCFPFADRMLSPIPSMSPIPSIASDMGFARSTARPPPIAQRSPRVAAKGPMTPTRSRSRRSTNHHSFGSEAALHQLQMEHYTPVR